MNNNFFAEKNILVSGGKGFLGSHLVELLKRKGPQKIIVPNYPEWDFTKLQDCNKITQNVDVVIHLAVDGGGIGYMKNHPGSIFYNNIMMNTLIQEYSRKNGVEKFVGIGTVCSYPKFTEVPFKEGDLWRGYPEETNAPYGLTKKMMLVQSQAYREQYNFNAIHLLPVNMYGPRDDFDLKNSHVIPALIRKMVEAKEKGLNEVEIWGSGNASREFLYVKDCARGILMATEEYNKAQPINLGTGKEIKIKDLVYKIKDIVGFKGEIKWDTSKPDGQPRRCLDVSKAEKEFGFKSKTDFDIGLKETINWYLNNN